MPQIITEDPIEQLELLLSPYGIKTLATRRERLSSFLLQRYGSDDEEGVRSVFLQNLRQIENARVVIIGVPNDNAAGFERGSKFGPLGIRQQLLDVTGYYDQLEELGIIDIGDVFDHPLVTDDSMCQPWVISDIRKERWGHLGGISERLALPVSAHSMLERAIECIYRMNPQCKIFLLGGDHSNSQIPIDVLTRGSLNADSSVGILHFDAHTDLLQTRDGLPISYATWARNANEALGGPNKLVQVGIRISGKEKSYWEEKLHIHQHWAPEVLSQAHEKTIAAIIGQFKDAGVSRLYISNDIDALSPEFAAATGTPEPNGLPPQFICDLICAVGKHFTIVGSDIMEVAPPLSRNIPGEPERTLQTAAFLSIEQIKSLLGEGCAITNPFTLPQAANRLPLN